MADFQFKHDPPWYVPPGTPLIPQPITPVPNIPAFPLSAGWSLEKLKEYRDLLKRVKEMEEQLGCPCEPNKADYLALFEERIKSLEIDGDSLLQVTSLP